MIPARLDFQTWANADYAEELPFADGDALIDLSLLTFKASVRAFTGSPVELFAPTLTIGDDSVMIIGMPRASLYSAYVALVTVEPIVTAVYDLIITYPDGTRETWLEGSIAINPGVTQ